MLAAAAYVHTWNVAPFTVGLLIAFVIIMAASKNRRELAKTDLKLCKSCGTSHPDFARFCRQCGKNLAE